MNFLGLNLIDVSSVSYTHLDVYKRQFFTQTSFTFYHFCISKPNHICRSSSVVAVSYTHLDVYKRQWFGFTLTDLVFPTFLFVVGSAMVFSLPRYENMGDAAFLSKTIRRAILIFICGFVV